MKPLCPATNLTTQQQSELTVPQVDHTQSTPATCPTENFEMMSPAPNSGGSEVKYWGVRKRKWGKWVSEVRLPNSRERIWLGSYDSPEKAARAFDAASFCLRGHQARLNYPGDLPRVPPIAVTRTWTHQQIRAAAATHAHSAPTETEVPENSPMVPASEESEEVTEVSVSEASEEVGTAAETPVPDWSYLDLMTTNGFPLVDDFYYDFMALVDGAPGLSTVDAAAEEGGGGFEASTVLWNFHDS